MRMEINAFDWSFMPLINLNDMLRPQIVKFNLFVMRTRSNTIAKRVKFNLMNNSRVLLIGLNRFFGIQVPDVNQLIVTRYYIGGSW